MKKLIIVGANNFQLPLIKKAKDMGIETHVFAWEEGAVGKKYADYFYAISIVEKEIILEYSKVIKPNGIISIGSDLAMLTVNYIANELGLTGNSMDCTMVTTNKYLMRKKLTQFKLPSPKYYFVKDSSSIDILNIKYPVIVKPTDRSGSRGVTKVNKSQEIKSAIQRAISESLAKEVLIEEYVEGEEYSVEMISWKGEHHHLQITEKETSGAPYFIEKSHHQPATISIELQDKIINLIKRTLSALGIDNGASHSEIIINKAGNVFITEVGARMGGDYIGSDLVQLSTGYDYVRAVIDVSMGHFKEVKIIDSQFSGVYFLFPKPGMIVSIRDQSSSYSEIIRSEIFLRKGDFVPEIKESSQRPASFIYQSKQGKFIPESDIIIIETE